ncbi:polysaccharide deacetylase family protein [Paenibacillus silvae]|uniref:Polysaccharide deacetylase family protein n=1 Tax=Paenibacillus silvae TaxID=1325358 RepID=A0A2W6PC87_9BACL|nr:polysaccharide deacetylase family protein [Paenibacillus silvae]PZT55686.1 polysaccharide deacetylase family protein [Paenibacillus silvae]
MAEQSIIEQVTVQEKVVAFTFDDGPHPVYTPQVLDIFRRAGGHATFFMIGEEMEAHPDIAAEVHRAGHEIANHTHTHPNLTELTLEEAGEELRRAEQLVQKVTGGPARSFRPPYFGVNDDILALAAERGYRTIGAANGAARDWDNPGTQHIVEHSRSAVKPGSVLIFHDGYGDRSQTVEAVRVLVEELTADGYRLVTVGELLKLSS